MGQTVPQGEARAQEKFSASAGTVEEEVLEFHQRRK